MQQTAAVYRDEDTIPPMFTIFTMFTVRAVIVSSLIPALHESGFLSFTVYIMKVYLISSDFLLYIRS